MNLALYTIDFLDLLSKLTMIESKRVPSEFLTILQQEGVSLQSEGVADVALAPVAALRAVATLRSAQIGITGGEVWEKKGDRFVLTYDIWNVEKSDYTNYDEFVQASLAIAERQVKKYVDSQDKVFLTLGI